MGNEKEDLKKGFNVIISDIFDKFDSYSKKEKKKIETALNELENLHEKLAQQENNTSSLRWHQQFRKRFFSFLGGKKN